MYIDRRSRFTWFRSSKIGSLPNNFDLIARSFDEKVLRRLKSLTPISTDSPSLTSLSWLSQAVDVLSSTHAEAQALITNFGPSSDDTTSFYLDASVKILDVCNSISSEMERLHQGRLLINFVLQLLEFSGEDQQLPEADKLRRSKELLSDWEIKPSRNRRTTLDNGPDTLIGYLAAALGSVPPCGKISSSGHVIRHTIFSVGVLTVFVAGMASAALCGIFPEDIVTVGVPSEFLWSETLKDLQSAILKRRSFQAEKKAWSLEEVDDVDKRVRALRDVINGVVEVVKDDSKETVKLENAVKQLEAAMGRFSNGVDSFSDVVNDTFSKVLCNRNSMLEEYRKSHEVSCEKLLQCKGK